MHNFGVGKPTKYNEGDTFGSPLLYLYLLTGCRFDLFTYRGVKNNINLHLCTRCKFAIFYCRGAEKIYLFKLLVVVVDFMCSPTVVSATASVHRGSA